MTYAPFPPRHGAARGRSPTRPGTARPGAGRLEVDDNGWARGSGFGVREIRIRDASGAFRIIYVTKFADAIHLLHCFQKKTQRTSKADLDLVKNRYRDLMKELGQ